MYNWCTIPLYNDPRYARAESQFKNFWQTLVATFCPLFTRKKGTKCGDQGLSKNFVLWFYSNNEILWKNLLLGGGQLLSWRTVDCWILSTLGSVLCNCPASNPNWTRSKRKVNKSLYLLDNKALNGWWGCPSQLLTVQAVLLCWTHIINQSISQWASQVLGLVLFTSHFRHRYAKMRFNEIYFSSDILYLHTVKYKKMSY